MGLGKIVGLGDFAITYSSTPNYTYYNNSVGNSVTISKDLLINEDFWKRVMTIGQIKFVLYGGKGGDGASTNHGRGGSGGKGLVIPKIYNILNSNDSFVLELSGSKYYENRGGNGGKGPVPTAPTNNDPENAGKAGIGGGGGGGCSGESMAKNVYSPGTGNVLDTYIGGGGGNGGHGCSVYVRKGSITEILATACGGGGGGGAAGFASSLDGEGGLAGEGGRIVNGVPTPGKGGSGQRKEDNNADGEDAFAPSYDYTSTSLQPRIEVFAPQW